MLSSTTVHGSLGSIPPWLPKEWERGYASYDLLATNQTNVQQDLVPGIGNGFIASLIDSGIVYAAGSYTFQAAGHAQKPSRGATATREGTSHATGELSHHDSSLALGVPLPMVHLICNDPAKSAIAQALDMRHGSFYRIQSFHAPSADIRGKGSSSHLFQRNRLNASGISGALAVSSRRYAHATRPSLLVYELNATNAGPSTAILNLSTAWAACQQGSNCSNGTSQDQPRSSQAPWPLGTLQATAVQAEWPGVAPAVVAVAGDAPANGTVMRVPPGQTVSLLFLTAVAISRYNGTASGAATPTATAASHLMQKAEEALREARSAGAAQLWAEHADSWEQQWLEGSISIEGDGRLAAAVNASLYAIYLSLREGVDEGISPGSLATGSYNANRFWDMDTWMFPPLSLLRRDGIAQGLLRYRQSTIAGALFKASFRGYDGAMWPWQAAGTGYECQPFQEGYYENHVSGDVAVAHEQMLGLLGGSPPGELEAWLPEAWPLINGTAAYWLSRISPMQLPPQDSGRTFGILVDRVDSAATGEQLWPTPFSQEAVVVLDAHNVMSPDEYHWPVNASAYTNAVAARSLVLGATAAKLLGDTTAPVEAWLDAARRLGVPYSSSSGIHPESSEWLDSDTSKQADVVLLGFPLEWPGLDARAGSRTRDLQYYVGKTDANGPAMTYAMFAVGWLDLQQPEKALPLFTRGYANVHAPFNVWRETPTGGAQQFVTGAGGFLQSVLMGYGGLRIRKPDPSTGVPAIPGLDWWPNAPPAPSTRITLRGVDIAGCSLRLTVSAGGVLAETERPCNGGMKVVLAPWGSPHGQGADLPASGAMQRYRLDVL